MAGACTSGWSHQERCLYVSRVEEDDVSHPRWLVALFGIGLGSTSVPSTTIGLESLDCLLETDLLLRGVSDAYDWPLITQWEWAPELEIGGTSVVAFPVCRCTRRLWLPDRSLLGERGALREVWHFRFYGILVYNVCCRPLCFRVFISCGIIEEVTKKAY